MPTPVSDIWARYRNLYGIPKPVASFYMTGFRADRIDGKLQLRDLGLYRRADDNLRMEANGTAAAAELNTLSELNLLDMKIRKGKLSESYSKLRGKLYKGNAALGVTLGSYKQSREMVVKRYGTLTKSADGIMRDAARFGSRGFPRGVASLHLETVFGWAPLIADIAATCLTVCQSAPVTGYISGRAGGVDKLTETWRRNTHKIVETSMVQYHCTRSATYTVTNPNAWLAERAGLLNPAAVAWDLVPWSFVVNMVVNTGQLVNSITDFVGLDFPSSSTTETWKLAGSCEVSRLPGYPPGSHASAAFVRTLKIRNLDGVARPPLVTKLPDVNWELAAIAASLFTQKFSSISALLSKRF